MSYSLRRNNMLQELLGFPFERRICPRYRQPALLMDQNFGLGLTLDDLVAPARSIRELNRQVSGSSELKNDSKEFKIILDVNQFAPEEINVKMVEEKIISIEAKHEEKEDEHGYISRQFCRKYTLPDDVQIDKIETSLSKDGILKIVAPKLAIEDGRSERALPIKMDAEEEQKGN